MTAPFIFGKIAKEENFTDRERETEHLVQNFISLINTVIISPRRWGKSSLVNKVASVAMSRDKELRVCAIDLFNVRSEQHFYSLFAQKVIAATSLRWEESVESAKTFFKSLVPKISIGTEPGSEISFDFDWEEVKNSPDEVLDLAERIAVKKGLKIVVCIDEFQNISEFSDPVYFQKKLRAHWQHHQHVSYCLYGSKRHMMLEVFASSSMPFYKFGDMMFLEKISTPYLTSFISTRFKDTGKEITEDACEMIVRLVDNHPYYAQQLAQLSWLRTQVVCDVSVVQTAHQSLVEQLSLLFVTITESLTNQQVNFLRAVIAGEKHLYSSEVMKKYRLSSATAVSRSMDVLIKNDVLDKVRDRLSFQDPIYAYWLKYYYFV